MSAQGHKVTSDAEATRNPIHEGAGLVTSDSLAAESANAGGKFSDNVKAAVSSQPSASTTSNVTDSASAAVLSPAPDAEARQATEEWDDHSKLSAVNKIAERDREAGGGGSGGASQGTKTGGGGSGSGSGSASHGNSGDTGLETHKRGADVEQGQANLPLPEQPPVASDWNSMDERNVNLGAGASDKQKPTGELHPGTDHVHQGSSTGTGQTQQGSQNTSGHSGSSGANGASGASNKTAVTEPQTESGVGSGRNLNTEIQQTQANLPLPEQPPVASDWNSMDERNVNLGPKGR